MKKKTPLILMAILAIGFFLRFYNLGQESFWLDEGATALAVKKHGAFGILKNIKETGNMLPEYYGRYYDDDLPLYLMLLSGWVNIFGLSELSFRAFSSILGSIALILIFFLIRMLTNEKIALLTTFLASINLTLIWYSQEARQYSFLFLLSMASLIFLLKSLREKKTIYIAGFVAVNSFMVFSHFPWAIFIFMEGLYAVYYIYREYSISKKINVKILIGFASIGLMYLTIIHRALFTKTATAALYGRPNLDQIARFGTQLSTWIYPSVEMKQKIFKLAFTDFSLFEWTLFLSVASIVIIYGVLFINGLLNSYKKKEGLFLIWLFVFPIAFAALLSYIHPIISVFHIKQLIYIIPAFLAAVSMAILNTKHAKSLIAIIMLLNIVPIFAYFENIDKEQFREAAQFLPKEGLILVNIDTAQAALKYYYGEENNLIGIRNVEELKLKLNPKVESFWFVYAFTKYSDPKQSIRKYLEQNFKTMEKKQFFDLEIVNYSR